MRRTLFALLLLVPGLAAALPYGLKPELDIPLAAGLMAMKYHSGALLAHTRARGLDLGSLHRGDLPAFDRWAVGYHSPSLSAYSSVLAGAGLLVPLAVNARALYTGEQRWTGLMVDALLLQEAWLLSSALSSYAKSLPMHSTPLTYDPDVPVSEKNQPQNVSSFFSNHTTTAFTTAVFSAYTFQLRYPESRWVPWVWGGSLAVATGVGTMRVMAGKHFPSDVVAGAAVGALCGYLVPRLHLGGRAHPAKRKDDGPERKWNWDLGMNYMEGVSMPVPTLQVNF